ncbi:MAG: sensor domain-containing diguanylate cyclase, partial [Nitrospirota bacterium]
DLEKVLKDVLAYLSKLELISTDGRALIFLADESKKQLRLAAYQEVSEDFIRSEEVVNYGDGLCGIPAETGEIIISPDCLSDKRQSRRCENIVKHGHIILPLKVREKLVGVLCLFTTPLQEVSDRVIHLYKTIADIISVAIENAKIHKTTLEIARTDGLTGLYNHTEFQHILDLEVQRAKRYGREFSLLMLDIDFFKNFNDTYGHQTGDDILKAISQNIKKEVRVMDVSARYGGEEFAVILPETPLQFGVQVAERLCKTVSCQMFHIQGSNVQVTLSIGVASFPADAETSDDLIKRADQALYLAKNGGRNKVCQFTQLEKDAG